MKLMLFILIWSRNAFDLWRSKSRSCRNLVSEVVFPWSRLGPEVTPSVWRCVSIMRPCGARPAVAPRPPPRWFLSGRADAPCAGAASLPIGRSFFCVKTRDLRCRWAQLSAVPLLLSAGPTATSLRPWSRGSLDFQQGCRGGSTGPSRHGGTRQPAGSGSVGATQRLRSRGTPRSHPHVLWACLFKK